MDKPKVLVVGDSITETTGFATVVYNIFSRLKEKYDIYNLAINYVGDWNPLQSEYKLFPANITGDDPYGFKRVGPLVKAIDFDLVFVIQDPYIADTYAARIRETGYKGPLVLYTPVDGLNLSHKYISILNLYNHVVAYTEFGRQELQRVGLKVPCSVIPHGVDRDLFKPGDKVEAREFLGAPLDAFIVQYVGMNQPRKKVDYFLWVMNEWLRRYPHDDVWLYYHGPLKRRGGIDIEQYISEFLDPENERLGYTHKLTDRVFATATRLQREYMPYIYQSADLYLQTCAAEGWGLPLHEAMACGIPAIVPKSSALAEWPNGGVEYVSVNPVPDLVTSGINIIQHSPDHNEVIEALERLYRDEQARKDLAIRGYQVATQDKYSWNKITNEFYRLFESLRNEIGKEKVD